MSNPQEFISAQEPIVLPGENLLARRDEVLPEDESQPEAQGDEPGDAALGDDGQGDIDVDPDLGLANSPEDLRESEQ